MLTIKMPRWTFAYINHLKGADDAPSVKLSSVFKWSRTLMDLKKRLSAVSGRKSQINPSSHTKPPLYFICLQHTHSFKHLQPHTQPKKMCVLCLLPSWCLASKASITRGPNPSHTAPDISDWRLIFFVLNSFFCATRALWNVIFSYSF